MIVFASILFLFEVLSFLVIREQYLRSSRIKFYVLIIIHLALSAWMWITMIRVIVYKGFFDNPENINNQMVLAGLLVAVFIPRVILSILHFAVKLVRIRKGGHIRWITRAGIIYSAIIFIVVASGSLIGRFNFKTEEVTVVIKELDPALNGIKIVHLSDMHLSSFYHHTDRLEEVITKVTHYDPDLIINTGDFVTFGWREFGRCDTILSKAKGTYGKFAVLGNHDMGTYLPDSDEEDRNANIKKLSEILSASGYHLLNDEHTLINIKGAEVAVIGVMTGGSYPAGIIHGDLKKAIQGTDSSDFKILLCHDPNQWDEDVAGKADIDLTFAGHTHGMQIGIITNKFRWSPAKRFYPHWNGLYSEGDQYLYVNRGLGTLVIPCRIWMPPEITVITLKAR